MTLVLLLLIPFLARVARADLQESQGAPSAWRSRRARWKWRRSPMQSGESALPELLQAGRYLRADGLTAFFLLNIAVILALVLVYSIGYLRHIPAGRFSSPRWFYSLTFLFTFTMIAVYLSANLGMLWICVESTTLASALLVGFYNTKGAVEAGWKYLVVCTVGIAFALFGTIALYLAAVKSGVNPHRRSTGAC